MPSTALLNERPEPIDETRAAAWKHSAMRFAMMEGEWRNFADDRCGDFFAPEVRAYLPPAEISGNPALSIVIQTSTLYDDPAKATAYGPTGEPIPDEALAALDTPEAWAMMQEVLESVNGLNDCFVLTEYSGGRWSWKVARPHEIEADPDPDNPDQPIRIRHLELSARPGVSPPVQEWTWTTYDARGKGEFKVEVSEKDDQGREVLVDVTDVYYPGLNGAYPYQRRDGTPIWTWVAYHKRITGRLFSPYRGRETWEGTLTYAALKTWWLGGVRDGAHPQRTGVDVEIEAAGAEAVPGQPGARVIRMNQLGVMLFRSIKDGRGALSQFQPGMDPKSAGEAIAAFAVELAVYAGIASQDVSISGGSTGQSGYAIAISRDGQRRARKRLEVPMSRGDCIRLAQGAALLNAYTQGPTLPEDPKLYRVQYAEMAKSLDEVKADLERADSLRAAGVLGLVDHYLQWHPGLTREQAIEEMVRNAVEEAEIQAMIAKKAPKMPAAPAAKPAAAPGPEDPQDPEDPADPGPDEPPDEE